MKEYELALVVSGNLNEAAAKECFQKAEKQIAEAEGKILKSDDWGRRKLAYKIKGADFGYYLFSRISLEPSKSAKLVESLRLNPDILRAMLINAKDIPEKPAAPKALESAKETPASAKAKAGSEVSEITKVSKPKEGKVKRKAEKKVTQAKNPAASEARVNKPRTYLKRLKKKSRLLKKIKKKNAWKN
jgi:small subunit ribosomal protein S6